MLLTIMLVVFTDSEGTHQDLFVFYGNPGSAQARSRARSGVAKEHKEKKDGLLCAQVAPTIA